MTESDYTAFCQTTGSAIFHPSQTIFPFLFSSKMIAWFELGVEPAQVWHLNLAKTFFVRGYQRLDPAFSAYRNVPYRRKEGRKEEDSHFLIILSRLKIAQIPGKMRKSPSTFWGFIDVSSFWNDGFLPWLSISLLISAAITLYSQAFERIC